MSKKTMGNIHDKDTGSSEIQIALLTEKLKFSQSILNSSKDKHSSVGLLKAVNRRKIVRLSKKEIRWTFTNVLSKLNLRK